jgi:hypothetical protein
MSDQTPLPAGGPVAEEDLRAAQEHVRRAAAILREALAEDERLAAQAGGAQR